MSVTISGSGQIVKQVVTATSSTAVTNNTSTYVSTGLTANITPSNSANKILVTASVPIQFGSSNYIVIGIRVSRGGTIVYWNILVVVVVGATCVALGDDVFKETP